MILRLEKAKHYEFPIFESERIIKALAVGAFHYAKERLSKVNRHKAG